MSSSGTPQMTARNSSGRWVSAAPTSSPPFERPEIASRAALVTFFAISYSAAAMKSSKTFCLCPSMPGLVPGLAVLAPAAQDASA